MKPLGRGRRLVLAALVAAAALTAALLLRGGDEEGSDLFASGTVEATEGHLGFQAAGRLAEIRVREGDPVAAGDTLALLEREEVLARRDAAEAQVAEAEARLRELERGFRAEEVEQARAALAVTEQRREDAARDLERTRTLYDGGAVSREALDKAATALEVARGEARRAAESLRLLEAGPRPEAVDAQRARLAGARAALRGLDAALEQMVVVAPFGGLITVRHREPGEVVAPGVPVLTVMDPDDRWVRIYVREDRIGAVRIGQPASVTTDTYADRAYEGRVRFIASEAEFTPKAVQTAEERVKLVYAVKVRIAGDPARDLKPGMPADVRLALDGTGR